MLPPCPHSVLSGWSPHAEIKTLTYTVSSAQATSRICRFPIGGYSLFPMRRDLFPSIPAEQTFQKRNLNDPPVGILFIRFDHFAAKSGMGAIMVPILQKFIDGKMELFWRAKYDLVQTFQFQCTDKIFHPTVHIRCVGRCPFDRYTDGFENIIEWDCKGNVIVPNQVFLSQQKSIPGITPASGDLCCPLRVGIMRDSSTAYFSRATVHTEKRTVSNQTKGINDFSLRKTNR